MKFKPWVTAILIILFFVFWFLVFADMVSLNITGLVGMTICVYLLTKYSDICN